MVLLKKYTETILSKLFGLPLPAFLVLTVVQFWWWLMKVGDLVNFHTSFEPFLARYRVRNPGIVLTVTDGGGWGSAQTSIEVLWANEDVTTEFSGYLALAQQVEGCFK